MAAGRCEGAHENKRSKAGLTFKPRDVNLSIRKKVHENKKRL